jgi:translation initiation factor 4A
MTETSVSDNEVDYIANSWDDLDIPVQLLRGIYAYGFEHMSPIQKKAIQPMMIGRDIIAQAQSGTGKTATFTIGSLSNINLELNHPQVLVLSPTRELSKQTASVFNGIGCMMNGLQIQTLVGGSSVDEDLSILRNNPPHVIVGCPGRVFDILKKNNVICKNIKTIILDEADEMLSFGFKEQVYNILQLLDKNIQICLFSATLPDYINVIIDKIMKDPIRIQVKSEQLTLEGISQYYIAIENDQQKYDTLKDLYSLISMSQCIIYANSLQRVSDLYDAMSSDGFPVCCIHSNMEKEDRYKAFTDFKVGKYRVLISSNVTARGIDIQQVSIVINFDLPKCTHTYLHRIGRSGRWGRKGVGINFITRRDVTKIREIETHYATQISELPSNIDKIIC